MSNKEKDFKVSYHNIISLKDKIVHINHFTSETLTFRIVVAATFVIEESMYDK